MSGTMEPWKRLVAALIGAVLSSVFVLGLWWLKHPYAATFLVGAIFQNLWNCFAATIEIGQFRFASPA